MISYGCESGSPPPASFDPCVDTLGQEAQNGEIEIACRGSGPHWPEASFQRVLDVASIPLQALVPSRYNIWDVAIRNDGAVATLAAEMYEYIDGDPSDADMVTSRCLSVWSFFFLSEA